MDSFQTRTRVDQHTIAVKALNYQTMAKGDIEVTPDWLRGVSGVQLPVFNIFQPLSDHGLTDDTLADTAAFFSSKQRLYAIELIHDRFPEGPDFLDKRQYQPLPPQPAMFLEAASLEILSLDKLSMNNAVQFEAVTTVPSLTAFCDILHRVFGFTLSDMITLFPVAQLQKDVRNKVRHYLAFVDEQPVGAGTIICLDGVVSLWNVCTLDQYRRQGIATTLVHQMLGDARRDGCDLMMLYSTPHAYHLFSKFGFEMYTQRTLWQHQHERQT
ncbi:MAG: GNAT family N-acetyltransferase, partial [Chloroflexota bacterium]